jgi:DNA-binding CsgD family transcriptional regulator
MPDAQRHPPYGARLTKREREIMVLSCKGRTECEIGQDLGISRNTVRIHVQNIRHKLGARNKPHSIVRALLNGQIALAELAETV